MPDEYGYFFLVKLRVKSTDFIFILIRLFDFYLFAPLHGYPSDLSAFYYHFNSSLYLL